MSRAADHEMFDAARDHNGNDPAAEIDDAYWALILAEAEAGTDPTAQRTEFRDLPAEYRPQPIEWLVRGLITSETHGEIGGAQKSLKTYVALTIGVGLALGKPVLGRFDVPERKRVLLFAGEGGERMLLARIHRICAAYGANWSDLAGWLRYTTKTAPITSPAFVSDIRAEVAEFDPAFVSVDPWYVYAGSEMSASQLNEVGDRLEQVRRAVGPGRALFINHHLNSTGAGTGIVRLSGAGHAEWVDSWLLLSHRTPPDVYAGRFRLALEVGSRQWGGGKFDVDYDIGHFDTELGQHDGPIRWVCQHANNDTSTGSDDDAEAVKAASARTRVTQAWTRRRGNDKTSPITRTEWIERTEGRALDNRAAFYDLRQAGHIICVDNDPDARSSRFKYVETPAPISPVSDDDGDPGLGF